MWYDITMKKNNTTLRQIHPNVFLFTYDTKYDLCMSFVRMQEFYESPKFKGQHFTLEEFIDWWSLEMSRIPGAFDYPARWSGFNFPGEVLSDWLFECDEDVLRGKELYMLRKLAKRFKVDMDECVTGALTFHILLKDKLKGTYIIGCHREKGDSYRKETIEHEVAHAFYHLYPDYRKQCKKIIKDFRKKDIKGYKEAIDLLVQDGYDIDVAQDEMQAYFATDYCLDLLGTRKEFISNFEDFKKKLKKLKK